MKFSIRPVDQSRDIPELAKMLDQVMTQGMTEDHLRAGLASAVPLQRDMVAVDEAGRIVGWSMIRREPNEPENRAFTSMIAHPDHRRMGIGNSLCRDVFDHALSLGISELKARVRDDNPGWLAWAKFHDFEISRHSFRSSINLADFDESPYVDAIRAAEASGIRFLTLEDVGDTPAARRKAADVDIATARDIPGADHVWTWEQYEADIYGHPAYHPDGVHLASDGDRWIGIAQVGLDREHDRMENWMTGVLPEYRGRKIALALKLLAIRTAKRYGVSEIMTENDSENAPMLAINRKLGYKPWPGAYELKAFIG